MGLIDGILKSRGYETKAEREAFLSPDYKATKYDPFLLPDMERAVKRLVQAKEKGETVAIYGDYDIDGLTASTVLLDSFEKFGLNASVFIPNRFVEGYGLSADALTKLAENGANLVVTVDCGSLSHQEIDHANELGLDVIVTDHHSVAETMPAAVAVVNPKRLLQNFPEDYENYVLKPKTQNVKSNKYPFLDLAGVGVAFKLVQALQTRLDGLPDGHEKWLLDLVALGTVCDVVELRDENRSNVYWGLEVMKKTRRIGLKMLMAVAKIDHAKLNSRALGFMLGPRLNAAGRLETAQLALELLTTSDSAKALALAEQLDAMNLERRSEQARIFAEAVDKVQDFMNDRVIVVSDTSWSHGIIGIVAAKLLETYQKPAFVLQELEDGTAKGSARSFGDFSAVEGIRATEKLLIKGGGHKLAAGITLEATRVTEWRTAINTYYDSLKLSSQEKYLLPKADATIDGFSDLNEDLIDNLTRLEPFGNGNPEPVFCVLGAMVVERRLMGADGQHVAYNLKDPKGNLFRLVAWNAADKFTAESDEIVNAWFEVTLNEWRGRRSVEGRLLRLEVAPL